MWCPSVCWMHPGKLITSGMEHKNMGAILMYLYKKLLFKKLAVDIKYSVIAEYKFRTCFVCGFHYLMTLFRKKIDTGAFFVTISSEYENWYKFEMC